MKIKEIVNKLEAKVVYGEELLDNEVEYGFASDLLSDVLVLNLTKGLLITGLANIQALRTAEIMDMHAVLLVRGKCATEDMKNLAKEKGIVLLEYSGTMFKACGILYAAGLKPVY